MRAPRRVLGYARVSSEEQAKGTSLDDQQHALEVCARGRGLAVTRCYVEAESAVYEKIERRVQMQALLADLRAGDLVLCDKLDRWSRDPEFTYRSVRQIHEAGASVYFVAEACDPSTKEGDTMLGFRVLMAREEHKRIRERMVGTRQLMRDRGYYTEGLPPVGYERSSPRGTRSGEAKNVLRVVPEGAALVRRMFELAAAGKSIADIVADLQCRSDARAWDKKSVNNVLRNRLYLGEVKSTRGLWIPGHHPAIVTPELFARVQVGLTARRLGGAKPSSESRTATWILRDLARCASCGAKMSASYGAGGRDYYRCARDCGARYVRVDLVEPVAVELVAGRLVELRAEIAAGADTTPPPAVDYASKRAALEGKRDRYSEMYAEGKITKAKFDAGYEAVVGALTKLAEDERRDVTPLSTPKARRELLGRISQVRARWREAKPAIRRIILREVAHDFGVGVGPTVTPRWKTAEELAVEKP